MSSQKNDSFKTQLGLILAAAGSAIGLGNLWGFPYKAGENGGSVFIAIYLFFALAVGLPLMISEFIIGKHSSNNSSVRMFYKMPTNDETRPKKFAIIGILGTIASLLIATFYAVIAGWSIDYFLTGITQGYSQFAEGTEMSAAYFNALITDFGRSGIYAVTFILLAIVITFFGINDGIEKASKILMPALFIILIILLINGFMSGGFNETLDFLFTPRLTYLDGTDLNVGKTAIAAMSQAFFSLSLGLSAMITYASYMKKDTKVIGVSFKIVLFDTIVAFLAGFAVFPILFSLGGDPASGPGLVFISLTVSFATIPFGRILGIFTFLLLFIAALTSIVSMIETIVSAIIGGTKLPRKPTVIIVGVVIILGSILNQPALGIAIPFLQGLADNLIDQLDKLTMNFVIPIVTLLIAIFVGFRMKKELVFAEFRSYKVATLFYAYLRYVIPLLVFIVFISGILAL